MGPVTRDVIDYLFEQSEVSKLQLIRQNKRTNCMNLRKRTSYGCSSQCLERVFDWIEYNRLEIKYRFKITKANLSFHYFSLNGEGRSVWESLLEAE